MCAQARENIGHANILLRNNKEQTFGIGMCKISYPESHLSSGQSKDLRSKGALFEGSVEMFSVNGFPTRIHFHGPLVLSFGAGWEQWVLSTLTLSANLGQACKRSGSKPVLPELTNPPSFRVQKKRGCVSCPSMREKELFPPPFKAKWLMREQKAG